jgi:hypothetical protein
MLLWAFPLPNDVPAAQNLLPNQRNHHGVMNVVVGRIGGRDSFKGKPSNKTDDARIARFEQSVGPLIRSPKLVGEGFDHDLCGVEHLAELGFGVTASFLREGLGPVLLPSPTANEIVGHRLYHKCPCRWWWPIPRR